MLSGPGAQGYQNQRKTCLAQRQGPVKSRISSKVTGRKVPVLIGTHAKRRTYEGHTDNYIPVVLKTIEKN